MTYKDPDNAFLIELVGGFFGLMGLGYLYAGRTEDGIIRLIAWMAYVAFAWIGITLLSFIIIGLLCIPVQLVIQVGVPIWSAMSLKNSLVAQQSDPPGHIAPPGQLPSGSEPEERV
jgi:TM2 domain-containing membrane protein YozV